MRKCRNRFLLIAQGFRLTVVVLVFLVLLVLLVLLCLLPIACGGSSGSAVDQGKGGVLAAGGTAGTGGVSADLFPSCESVADFILDCVRKEVAFKATAGLHHPLRSIKPLTYAADAPAGVMHGFLNVFVAAILAEIGIGRQRLLEVLRCEDAREFQFTGAGLSWRDLAASTEEIAEARELFAISFGSCWFEEPVSDLKQLGLL